MKWAGYKWLVPLCVILAIIEIIPFLIMIDYSIRNINYRNPTAKGEYVGLDNYRKVLDDVEFGHSIWVLVKLLLVALPLEFLIGLGVALALAQHQKLKKFLLPIIIVPMIISPVVVGLIGKLNFNADFGLIGIVMRNLGLVEKTILGDYRLALPTIIAIEIWEWTPFIIMIFTAGLLSLPKDPYEAATVDGSTKWQIFRFVTLPLLKPIFLVALLLRFTDMFKIFDTIFIMTEGGPGAATEVSNIFAYRVNFRIWDIGYGATVVSLLWAISLLVCLALVKVITTKETE
jgi:multiple sugar transport system permease protein